MQKIKPTLLVLLSLWALVLLPDVILGLFNGNYLAGYDAKSITITMLIMLFLMLSRTPKLNVVLLLCLALMQATQTMYFQYFGGFYSAFDMLLMLDELHDAVIGFADGFRVMVLPLMITVFFYAVAHFTYKKYQANIVTLPYISILLVLVFTLPFLQSLRSESSQKYQPNIAHSSVKNGLYSASYFMAHQLKTALGFRKAMPVYLPYEVSSHGAQNANVVMIMGESLSQFNMGLFGYERDTTPDLTPYISNSSFFHIPAISSAVSTRVSLALFFNTVYEPNNATHLSKMDTALFKLAKKSGFNTHYITTQKNAGGLTYSFSLADIDTWKEDKHLSHYEGEYDNRLLLELESMKLDYSQPQFVTLHMRSAHVPYVDNYPAEQATFPVEGLDFDQYMVNSYDNSVLYTQKVIADIYKHFEKTGKPTYIFFVPDHGELLGQGGRFGHNAVDIDMAKVPFLFYGANLPQSKVDEVKTELGCLSNHYLISKEIASVLGFSIENPNQEEGIYYLNGTDVFGEAGFLKYELETIAKQECKSS